MLGTNPFSILAETVSPFAMQSFIIAMIVLIALGTIIQMIHHKNITYFFLNHVVAIRPVALHRIFASVPHHSVRFHVFFGDVNFVRIVVFDSLFL